MKKSVIYNKKKTQQKQQTESRGGGAVGAFAPHAEGWVFESQPRQT